MKNKDISRLIKSLNARLYITLKHFNQDAGVTSLTIDEFRNFWLCQKMLD